MDLQSLAWQTLGTAPHVHYVLADDSMGQTWIYFACDRCQDTSRRLCTAPAERGPHWVATYAAVHTH